MPVLKCGMFVHYFTEDSSPRPLLVINQGAIAAVTEPVGDPGTVSGRVFFDPLDSASPIMAGVSGVPFDADNSHTPGTWNFMP